MPNMNNDTSQNNASKVAADQQKQHKLQQALKRNLKRRKVAMGSGHKQHDVSKTDANKG